MKKLIIAALVGGLILFVWQFLSWSLLDVHRPHLDYTPNQDEILKVLSENLEEGSYFLPTLPSGYSAEEQQALQEKMTGKPWATISYHPSFSVNMGSNMARGFIIDFVAVLLLAWLLSKFRELTFSTAMTSSLAVGIIGYLSINYLDSIWFESNSIPYLIDAVVAWGAVGAWLGFWMTRSK